MSPARLSSARLAAALLLALSATALSLLGGAPEAPALLLAVATAVGAGSLLALPVGLVAVLVAATPTGQALTDPLVIVATALSGAALGLALHAAGRAARRPSPDRAVRVTLAVAAVAALAALLPDGLAVLLAPDGRALPWTLGAQDARTGLLASVVAPAAVPLSPPLAWLGAALPALLALAALTLLGGHIARHAQATRVGYLGLAACAALLAVFGAAGLVQLLGGATLTVDDPAQALERLHLATGGHLALTSQAAPQGALGLASRPAVDPLRLVLGLALAFAAFRGLRPAPAPTPTPAPTTSLPAFVALALLVAAAGALFASGAALAPAVAHALLAGAVLMAVGLFTALATGRAPWASWAAAALVVALAWLAPWAGWSVAAGVAG